MGCSDIGNKDIPSSGEVLFISHDASGTGAPYVLLLLLGWLKQRTSIRFRVVLASGGSREESFRSLAPTYSIPLGNGWVSRYLLRLALRISWRLYQKLSLKFLKRYIRRCPIALIYSNTITNGLILSALSETGAPVITHVHELQSLFEQCTQEGSLTSALNLTNRFIAVADAVKSNLVENFGVAPSTVDLVRGFIDLEGVNRVKLESARRKVVDFISAGPDECLVVGCGTLGARKGPDLFLSVAERYNRHPSAPQVHFVWVGGQTDSREYATMTSEAVSRRLQDRVHFVGHRADYLDFLAAADVFLMTSREDPFPLVLLEAAALGRPIVCFNGGGGSPEFVRNDAGLCVPFEDVTAMTDAVIRLMRSPEKRAELGETARRRAYKDHSVDAGSSNIYRIINDLLSAK